MDLLGVYLLVLVSMGTRDCLGTISTACIVHGRKLLAGAFDGLCDIAGVISITATGAVTLEHGVTLASVIAFLALFVGSVLGTYGGMTVESWLARWTASVVASRPRHTTIKDTEALAVNEHYDHAPQDFR